MSKKKKSNRGNPANSPKRVESNTRIVDAYRASRSRRGLDPDDSWLVGAALDLKRDYLASVDPRVWTEEELELLLTRVLPTKAILEDVDREVLPEVFEDFLGFMADTGRWSSASFPDSEISAVMARLHGPMRRGLADTSQRSLGANIAAFAQSQGVDFSEPGAVERFIEDYNSMSDADRGSISDGHGLPDDGLFGQSERPHLSLVPDIAGGPEWMDDDLFDDMDPEDLWPDFLGGFEDLDELARNLPEQRDSAADLEALGTELFRRADHILKWLGDGRQVTKTGALRMVDTGELLAQLDIPDPGVRSMWEIPELAGAWSTLIGGGFVNLRGTRATVNPDLPLPGESPSPEEDLAYRTVVHIAALHTLLSPVSADNLLMDPPLAFMAMVKAATPAGLPMPNTRPGADISALYADVDLRLLAAMGLVTIVDETAHCPEVLLPLLLTLPAAFSEAMDEEDDIYQE